MKKKKTKKQILQTTSNYELNWAVAPQHNELILQCGENSRSSCPEVFLGKGVLKICSKLTGDTALMAGNDTF